MLYSKGGQDGVENIMKNNINSRKLITLIIVIYNFTKNVKTRAVAWPPLYLAV